MNGRIKGQFLSGLANRLECLCRDKRPYAFDQSLRGCLLDREFLHFGGKIGQGTDYVDLNLPVLGGPQRRGLAMLRPQGLFQLRNPVRQSNSSALSRLGTLISCRCGRRGPLGGVT
ncbi:hypothetical protein GUI43_01046 [Micromonospora noduli]|uniref:Uncharacterized protein n=1 Tax=Micromonospora noduli TaxID=709876 RepID=A0ABX9D8Q0_9ACTN|nr:hypothetical protein GUI43_01046 [Micromonospora noduli]RAO24669.1 hypothetical protein MED15_00427 [Micromonospora noduli]